MNIGLALLSALGQGLQTYGQGKKLTDARKDDLRQRNKEFDQHQDDRAKDQELNRIDREDQRRQRRTNTDLQMQQNELQAGVDAIKLRRDDAKDAVNRDLQMADPRIRKNLWAMGKYTPTTEDAKIFKQLDDDDARRAAKDTAKSADMDEYDKSIVGSWDKMTPGEQKKYPGGFKSFRKEKRTAFGVQNEPIQPAPEPAKPGADKQGMLSSHGQPQEKPTTGVPGIDFYNNNLTSTPKSWVLSKLREVAPLLNADWADLSPQEREDRIREMAEDKELIAAITPTMTQQAVQGATASPTLQEVERELLKRGATDSTTLMRQ